MTKNVHCFLFLTVVSAVFFASCKRDNAEHQVVANPEEEYFQDYEGPSNKWGFLDTAGNIVIPAKYDQVSAFRDGLAPVNLSGKWGYIDHAGEVVIPFEYRAAWQFHEGLARTIDFAGNPCVVDRSGNRICPEGMTEIFDFSEGLAVFQRGIVCGYIDTTGSIAIQPLFDQAWAFEHGSARVMRSGQQGLINRQGEFIVPAEYEKVTSPSSGRILVKQRGNFHFLDMPGNVVSKSYRQATPYIRDVAAVSDETGWFLIDLDGNALTEKRYAHLRPANHNRWVAKNIGMFAIIDAGGKELTSFTYSQINNYSEGYAGYLRDDLWGFIDTAGTEMTPPQFGLIWDFHNGFARAAFRDGIAFISSRGEVPFQPEYSELRDYSEGLAPFQE